jgi:integrase
MSKAANNDGSIFKKYRKDGSTYYCVEISLGMNAQGKRSRTRRNVDTHHQAKELRKKLLAEQQKGSVTVVRNETVKTFALYWVREVKPTQIRASTAYDYEDRLRRYVFPYLGKVRLIDLKSTHVQNWLLAMKKDGKSATTINGARRVLFGMCKHAARQGVIAFNPVGATDPIRRQPNEPTLVKDPWSEEEMKTVLARVEESALDCFLHLMLLTGMRPGEALGLRWEDVDSDKTQLWITGTLKQERRITSSGVGVVRTIRNPPKTAHSRRALTISPVLRDALVRHEMSQSVARLQADQKWIESGYVVTTSVGTPVSLSNLRRRYGKYLSSIDMRYIRLHDIRHSVAKQALEQRVPIEQVSQALGHTRIDTTKQIYAKHVPFYTENFISVLGASLAPSFNEHERIPIADFKKIEGRTTNPWLASPQES